MLPTTINLQDAQAILKTVVEKDDFNAVEITFRFINGNGKKEEVKDNGNGKGNNGSIIFPEEYITQLNNAKTVKQLFFIYYQYEKEMEHYSLADRNKVKTALNTKKDALEGEVISATRPVAGKLSVRKDVFLLTSVFERICADNGIPLDQVLNEMEFKGKLKSSKGKKSYQHRLEGTRLYGYYFRDVFIDDLEEDKS